MRRHETAHAVAEGQHADLVALALRHPGQQQGGVDRMIQLGEVPGGSRHQAPTIECDDRLLATLGFDLHDDRVVAAGCGFPVDPADVVPRQVLPQSRERGRRSRGPGATKPHHDPHASAQHQLVALDGEHVGIHRSRLVGLDAHLPDEPASASPATQVNRSERVATTMRRPDRVLDAEQTFPIERAGQAPAIGL